MRDVDLSSLDLSPSSRGRSGLPPLSDTSFVCTQSVYRELAPLGFRALQHIPDFGVHSSRVCRALYVPLAGFLSTLLAVSSSKNPLSHLSDPSAPGVHSFRVLLPSKIRTSLKVPCSLALYSATCDRRLFRPGGPFAASWTPELFSL